MGVWRRFKGTRVEEGGRTGNATESRALAAGEITAPSLLARDVHKLCITPSGAHVTYVLRTPGAETAKNLRATERDRVEFEALLTSEDLPRKGPRVNNANDRQNQLNTQVYFKSNNEDGL